MSLRRLAILFSKEVHQGGFSMWVLLALIIPLAMSLIVTLVFGDLFAQRPRLGLVDQGDSKMVALLQAKPHLSTTVFENESALRAALTRGRVVVGIVFPARFDAAVRGGAETDLTIMRWGEAGFRELLIIEAAIVDVFGDLVELEKPITIDSVQLGAADTKTWADRFLPFLVIYSLMLGGIMVPASSLVEEKQKRTLSALTTTPATLLEVFLAKALLGIVISTIMTVVMLALNRAFGNEPALLIGVLLLAATTAALFGVILGSLVKDENSLTAVIKGAGILLIGPAIVEVIPRAPEWIKNLFPTHYIINPVVEISIYGASFADIVGDMAVTLGIAGVLLVVLVIIFKYQKQTLESNY